MDGLVMNDRQRVELSLAPAMLRIALNGSIPKSERDAEYYQTNDLLYEALQQPIDDLLPDHAVKIARRVTRFTDEYLGRKYNNQDPYMILIMIIQWLKERIDDGYINLIDGSPFAEACDNVLSTLYKDEERFNAAMDEATKNAEILQQDLNNNGYFRYA